MQLAGDIALPLPPAAVRQRLDDAEVLRALLPGQAAITRTAPGRFDFTLSKSVGPLELRQSGKIELDEAPDGRLHLRLNASHLIGGSVQLLAVLGLTPVAAGCRAALSGKIEARGLAGRLLRDREAQVRPYTDRILARLKAKLLAPPSA